MIRRLGGRRPDRRLTPGMCQIESARKRAIRATIRGKAREVLDQMSGRTETDRTEPVVPDATPVGRSRDETEATDGGMGDLRVVYLTTEEPLYLPSFFSRVLGTGNVEALAVFATRPLYKNQTTRQAAVRYLKTFGWRATAQLAFRVLAAKARRRSVASVCASYGIPYEPVADVNDPEFLARLRALSPDVAVSVSCPQIFKAPLIQIPTRGILNIHGALLPHYRGVMPSFWMLANGETEAGVSIYFVNELIDAGDLCAQARFDIDPDESLDAFLQRSKRIAADLLLDLFTRMGSGSVESTPLDLSDGSYFTWPTTDAVAAFRESGRRLW